MRRSKFFGNKIIESKTRTVIKGGKEEILYFLTLTSDVWKKRSAELKKMMESPSLSPVSGYDEIYIINTCRKILAKIFKVDNDAVSILAFNSVKWDSIGHIRLIAELEKEFDIKITIKEMNEMKSFETITKIMISKLLND